MIRYYIKPNNVLIHSQRCVKTTSTNKKNLKRLTNYIQLFMIHTVVIAIQNILSSKIYFLHILFLYLWIVQLDNVGT